MIVSDGLKKFEVDTYQYCGFLTWGHDKVNKSEGYYRKRVKMNLITPQEHSKTYKL